MLRTLKPKERRGIKFEGTLESATEIVNILKVSLGISKGLVIELNGDSEELKLVVLRPIQYVLAKGDLLVEIDDKFKVMDRSGANFVYEI